MVYWVAVWERPPILGHHDGYEGCVQERILNLAIAVDAKLSALECLFVRLEAGSTDGERRVSEAPGTAGGRPREQLGMARQRQSFGSVRETGSGPSELPPLHQRPIPASRATGELRSHAVRTQQGKWRQQSVQAGVVPQIRSICRRQVRDPLA